MADRLQFESRMRRLKLSCSRWKMAYQREMHGKYQDLSAAMEERYMRCLASRTPLFLCPASPCPDCLGRQ